MSWPLLIILVEEFSTHFHLPREEIVAMSDVFIDQTGFITSIRDELAVLDGCARLVLVVLVDQFLVFLLEVAGVLSLENFFDFFDFLNRMR